MLGYTELYQTMLCHIVFMPIKKYRSVKEVAEYLQVHERTVYRLIKANKLKATKIGGWRVLVEDLEDFLKRSTNTHNAKRS